MTSFKTIKMPSFKVRRIGVDQISLTAADSYAASLFTAHLDALELLGRRRTRKVAAAIAAA